MKKPIILVDPYLSRMFCDLSDFLEELQKPGSDPTVQEFYDDFLFKTSQHAPPKDNEHRKAYDGWIAWIQLRSNDDFEEEECDCPRCTYHRHCDHDFDPVPRVLWLLNEIQAAAWVQYRRELKRLRRAA